MAMNLPEHRIKEILGSVNRLGNLQLLPASENLEKSRVDHQHVTKLPEFVAAREKLMWQNLQRLQLPVQA